MTWTLGRQGGGYLKWKILEGKTFDIYLLRYPTGSGVKYHTDPVRGKRHYRMNLILKNAKKGGHFRIRGGTILNWCFLKVFRPDLKPHAVEVVEAGERWVLSVGWVLPAKR